MCVEGCEAALIFSFSFFFVDNASFYIFFPLFLSVQLLISKSRPVLDYCCRAGLGMTLFSPQSWFGIDMPLLLSPDKTDYVGWTRLAFYQQGSIRFSCFVSWQIFQSFPAVPMMSRSDGRQLQLTKELCVLAKGSSAIRSIGLAHEYCCMRVWEQIYRE